jgi:hypothetical protein
LKPLECEATKLVIFENDSLIFIHPFSFVGSGHLVWVRFGQ